MTTENLLGQFNSDIQSTTTLEKLASLETAYLGRNGKVNDLMKALKDIPPAERKDFGKKVNELKTAIQDAIAAKKTDLLQKSDSGSFIDVTLPGTPYPIGSLHLVSYAVEEISKIFGRIGFIRMTYPEVEWEHFSFDALNIPRNHPARDDFETFFIEATPHPDYGKMVLTPHTSSGQTREMLRVGTPPIRMINISKTYRPNWDTTHTPMFHQYEGVCVDTHITISDLKGTIDYFAKEFFGEDRQTRLRPYHFQFTEPSFEVDITCGVCLGTGFVKSTIHSRVAQRAIDLWPKSGNPGMDPRLRGDDMIQCKVCKSGWLELGGAGMVHPKVLQAGKIDPEKYSGWAFGIGVERVMMMKEGIKLDDLRIMYNGDVRFLEQF